MKVKGKLLQRLLGKHGMTVEDFARDAEIDVSEVERMLNGESVGERTARKFIVYVGPIEAERLIDWTAMGVRNPFDCEADAERGDGCGENGGSNHGN